MHRDSMTGLWDKSFAEKEVERLAQKGGSTAILVRLIGSDNMPLYIAEEEIKRTGRIISNITCNTVARIKYGDFMIFSKDCEEADRIFGFLKEFRKEGFCHAVSAKRIDAGMDFTSLYRVLCAGISISQFENNKKAVY